MHLEVGLMAKPASPSAVVTRFVGDLFEPALIGPIVGAMNLKLLKRQFIALGACGPEADDAAVLELYFSRPECRGFSPNNFFDEAWYCFTYEDVGATVADGQMISGFIHFLKFGIQEGRWPNPILQITAAQAGAPLPAAEEMSDPAAYLAANPAARGFLEAFPFITPLQHYNLYGRFLRCSRRRPDQDRGSRGTSGDQAASAIQNGFDAEFYRQTYLSGPDGEKFRANPLMHYLRTGVRLGHSPNRWFDESWYRAFYSDIRQAIETGSLPSGFYHYLASGRAEGRIARYDMTKALEARIPGVTKPALLDNVAGLRDRLAALDVMPVRDGASKPAIWVLLPDLNPDITFGGYRAVFEMMIALRRDGRTLRIFCTNDQVADLVYFLWHPATAGMRGALADTAIYNRSTIGNARVGPHDQILVYSVWDLPIGLKLAALTNNKTPRLLAQEYEPVFYDSGSTKAICETLYNLPHFPIINSEFLLRYFKTHRIGVFATDQAREGVDYALFEHRLNIMPVQTVQDMAQRNLRHLMLYARPEAHAARNLFEVAVLGLQEACRSNMFGSEWQFTGLGALSELPRVKLGGGHELRLRSKLDEADYRAMTSNLDIGMSLMYAPHPSVVPFEFATTGALVITNIYENRSAEALRAISENIIPCVASIDGVVQALAEAAGRVGDVQARAAHALRTNSKSWAQIFAPAWLSTIFTNPDIPVVNSAASRRTAEKTLVRGGIEKATA
jgi:hypothetical protein